MSRRLDVELGVTSSRPLRTRGENVSGVNDDDSTTVGSSSSSSSSKQPHPQGGAHDKPKPKPKPKKKKSKTKKKKKRKQSRLLDGYALLSAAGVSLPEEVFRLDLSNAEPPFSGSEAAHLKEFAHLAVVDVSESRLTPFELSELVALEELCISCNEVDDERLRMAVWGALRVRLGEEVHEDGDEAPTVLMHKLEVLDMSYNFCSLFAMECMQRMPKLRQLDLSANSVMCPSDPLPLGQWVGNLQHLSLRRNDISSEDAGFASLLLSLGDLPQLRELDLSENRIATLPEELGGFPELQFINLSYNQVVYEEALLPLATLQALGWLDVRGNPFITLPRKRSAPPAGEVLDEVLVHELGVHVVLRESGAAKKSTSAPQLNDMPAVLAPPPAPTPEPPLQPFEVAQLEREERQYEEAMAYQTQEDAARYLRVVVSLDEPCVSQTEVIDPDDENVPSHVPDMLLFEEPSELQRGGAKIGRSTASAKLRALRLALTHSSSAGSTHLAEQGESIRRLTRPSKAQQVRRAMALRDIASHQDRWKEQAKQRRANRKTRRHGRRHSSGSKPRNSDHTSSRQEVPSRAMTRRRHRFLKQREAERERRDVSQLMQAVSKIFTSKGFGDLLQDELAVSRS